MFVEGKFVVRVHFSWRRDIFEYIDCVWLFLNALHLAIRRLLRVYPYRSVTFSPTRNFILLTFSSLEMRVRTTFEKSRIEPLKNGDFDIGSLLH